MSPSYHRLAEKGFSEDELLHIRQVFRRPQSPVHLLWLPVILLAQTLVMLRLLPLLTLSRVSAVMIAAALLSFAVSWILMQVAPELTRGMQGAAFAVLTCVWAAGLGLLLGAAGLPPELAVGRALIWAGAWIAPQALVRLWRRT